MAEIPSERPNPGGIVHKSVQTLVASGGGVNVGERTHQGAPSARAHRVLEYGAADLYRANRRIGASAVAGAAIRRVLRRCVSMEFEHEVHAETYNRLKEYLS